MKQAQSNPSAATYKVMEHQCQNLKACKTQLVVFNLAKRKPRALIVQLNQRVKFV